MENTSPFERHDLVVYGFGRLGRRVVDRLIDQDVKIAAIADANPKCVEYRGTPVVNARDLARRNWSGVDLWR